jgi:hypothetical protein
MWNEGTRLTAKFSQYASDSHKFKRFGPRDLEKVTRIERQERFNEQELLIRCSKDGNHERMEQRRAEREVIQYKAKQGMGDEEFVRSLEQEEPETFEELALKRRWSSVCKDPNIGIKDQKTIAPWPIVNHMSPKQVATIVTKKILKLDQESCKHILKSILEERREEELKKSL